MANVDATTFELTALARIYQRCHGLAKHTAYPRTEPTNSKKA
jgi:hypothetical protein